MSGYQILFADKKAGKSAGLTLEKVQALTHLTCGEAAHELGVTHSAVRYWSKKHGLKFRDGRLLTDEQMEMAHATKAQPVSPLPENMDALQVGKAGEHLACFDLLRQGYEAFLSDQGLPYDIVVDACGALLRVQVKTAVRPVNGNAKGRSPNFVYMFSARRRGKGGSKSLDTLDADIIAFVGIEDQAVAYFPVADIPQTVSLHPPGYEFPGKFKRRRHKTISDYSFEGALNALL